MTDYNKRLIQFRHVLKSIRLDAFIIPQADKWFAESLDDHDQILKYLTGLDASAGYAVITQDKAYVLIDGRYAVSAQEQVDTSLFEIGNYTENPPEIWAINALKTGHVIGYDSWLHSRKDAKRMQKTCNDVGVILQAMRDNPIDKIWDDRPAPLTHIAINHELEFCGVTVEKKLKLVVTALDKNNADSVIITAPDSIAWLLNMRSLRNSQAPGIRGFAVLQKQINKLSVFTDCDCTAFDYAQSDGFEVDFLPLDEFALSAVHFEQQEQTVQISDDAPDWFTEHLNSPASKIITRPDPCQMLKAIKNPVEQNGIRAAHMRDATAMKNIIKNIKKSKLPTEKQIDLMILNERQKLNLFRGVSFNSIVGWNANGAKIHGSPTDTIIEGNGLLLIDSGGQYDDGTTDITRTIAIGTPTKDMREKYTLVLKAHIALATAIFPEGTTGVQLDAIARACLWANGLDYAHGTGHGVGHLLNVHEGPCGISPKSHEPLQAGMLLSNEPGYYRAGAFGIRLENLMLVQNYKDKDAADNQTGKNLLCFETVTKVAFDEDCITRDMLSPSELKWLDAYQKECT